MSKLYRIQYTEREDGSGLQDARIETATLIRRDWAEGAIGPTDLVRYDSDGRVAQCSSSVPNRPYWYQEAKAAWQAHAEDLQNGIKRRINELVKMTTELAHWQQELETTLRTIMDSSMTNE